MITGIPRGDTSFGGKEGAAYVCRVILHNLYNMEALIITFISQHVRKQGIRLKLGYRQKTVRACAAANQFAQLNLKPLDSRIGPKLCKTH